MARRTSSTPQDVRPFSADAPEAKQFGALSASAQTAVAKAIAADKAAGLSGDELRAKYGARLTGPTRRKVLRAAGFDGTGYIARSYTAYRDGDGRTGTRHAREHGALAQQRRRQAAEDQAASTDLKTVRADLRESGLQRLPRQEAALRAAYAELLIAAATAMPA
jgi:hypothetical protein